MTAFVKSTAGRHYIVGATALFALLVLVGCNGGDDDSSPAPLPPPPVTIPFTDGAAPMSNAIAYWNKIATDTVNQPQAATGTPEETRAFVNGDMAAVHVAMYDAVNAITRTHTTFAATPTTAAAGASHEAAAAAAAYGVLKGLFPARTAQYQAAYDNYVASIGPGDPKNRGLAVGAEVATQILALRAGDGRWTPVTYTPGTAPGKFRGVNPIGPFIPFIKPFAMTSASQFRTAAPPLLDSAAYTTDFDEVRTLGGTISAARTAAQTDIARFHTEAPNTFPTRNYRSFAMDSRSTAENARLMAMIWVALADSTIACFESKYFHMYWRPLSAIPLADTDGNPNTITDASWTPIVPTPNHPEYPSGHACLNSAAMEVVRSHFGTTAVAFKLSSTVTGTQHSYATTNAFVDELMMARIYGGMHFRSACVAGNGLGTSVGAWVADNKFRPL